ncbi:MAG: chromosomal replication initiator DnaA [Robiginitomaculum sp.]|nr:chromosomal replication initiator DnaA [Robiginitomaculum sp.]
MGDRTREQEQALAQLVCAIVSIEFGVPSVGLISPTKGPAHMSFARQVSMYLMHVVFQVRISNVGHAFTRDPSTASYACHLIENEREDLLFDQKLQKLEEFLTSSLILKNLRRAG